MNERECPKCWKELDKTCVACRTCFKPAHLTCAGFRVFAEVYRQIWKNNDVHFCCVKCNLRYPQSSNESKTAVNSSSLSFSSSTNNPTPDLAEIFPVENNGYGSSATSSSYLNKVSLGEVIAFLHRSPEAAFQLSQTKISSNRRQRSPPAPSERHNLQQYSSYVEPPMYAPSLLPLFDDGISETSMQYNRQSYQSPYFADNSVSSYSKQAEPLGFTNDMPPPNYNNFDLTSLFSANADPSTYVSNEDSQTNNYCARNTGFHTLPISNNHQPRSHESIFAAEFEKFPSATPSPSIDEFLLQLSNIGDRPRTPIPYPTLNELPVNNNFDPWLNSSPFATSDARTATNYSSYELNAQCSMPSLHEEVRSNSIFAELRENIFAEFPKTDHSPRSFHPFAQNVDPSTFCFNAQLSNSNSIPFNGGLSANYNYYEPQLHCSQFKTNEGLSTNYLESSIFDNTTQQRPSLFFAEPEGRREPNLVPEYITPEKINISYPEIVKPIPIYMETADRSTRTEVSKNDRLEEAARTGGKIFPYECLYDSRPLSLNEPMMASKSEQTQIVPSFPALSLELPPITLEECTLATSMMTNESVNPSQNLSRGGWSSLSSSAYNSFPTPLKPISSETDKHCYLNEPLNPSAVSMPPQNVLMKIVIPSTTAGENFPATATVWLPNEGLEGQMQPENTLNKPLAKSSSNKSLNVPNVVTEKKPTKIVRPDISLDSSVDVFLPSKSCSPMMSEEELQTKPEKDSKAADMFKEPSRQVCRKKAPSIEYQGRTMRVKKNISKTVTGLSSNDSRQGIPIPKISIVYRENSLPTRHQSKKMKVRSTTTQLATLSKPTYHRRGEFENCIKDLIERLRTSERLKTPLSKALKRNVIWSPIRRDFGFCNHSTVWIPITRLTALDYSLKIIKYCNSLQQRRSVWIPIPPYIRRIVKSRSGILWIAVSRRMLVSTSLINASNVSPLSSTIRTVNAMRHNFADFLSPILARRILGEVQAGRLERSWIGLLSSQTMTQIIMDYWQIYRAPITHPIFCRQANNMRSEI